MVRERQRDAVGQCDGGVIAGFLKNGFAAEPVSLLHHADLISLVDALNGPAHQHHQRRIGRVALAQKHRVRANQREGEESEKRGHVRFADWTELPAGIHAETEKEAATDVRESRCGVHRGNQLIVRSGAKRDHFGNGTFLSRWPHSKQNGASNGEMVGIADSTNCVISTELKKIKEICGITGTQKHVHREQNRFELRFGPCI